MCGLAGIFNCDGAPVERGLLERMIDAVAHRGPDGEGHYVDGADRARASAAGDHRSVATRRASRCRTRPATSGSSTTARSTTSASCGASSRRAAISSGQRPTREVIVHAYEEWGDDCVLRLNGMFAFGLWDARRRRLLLARDRYGVKPLYYCAGRRRRSCSPARSRRSCGIPACTCASIAPPCSSTSRSRTSSPTAHCSTA